MLKFLNLRLISLTVFGGVQPLAKQEAAVKIVYCSGLAVDAAIFAVPTEQMAFPFF